jgi:hypothetical protein
VRRPDTRKNSAIRKRPPRLATMTTKIVSTTGDRETSRTSWYVQLPKSA